jgi:5-methylcytosine-specific restriction endonuclease McrA
MPELTIIEMTEIAPMRKKNGRGFTGRHHSPETCERLRLSLTGRPCTEKMMVVFKKPKTEEHKRKISESHKGMTYSDETKMRLSIVGKERKFSDETRMRMSESHKRICVGSNNPMFGKHPSPETIKKLSESHRGKNAGANHHNWKGGTSPLSNLIRKCIEYRQWLKMIFVRDQFTCTFCGIKGGRLEVHHHSKAFIDIFHGNNIQSLEQAISCEELWNLNNGITLCRKCHDRTRGK